MAGWFSARKWISPRRHSASDQELAYLGQRSSNRSYSAAYTPLVQPKPSCNGYSPPPPMRDSLSTSYFSIILPRSVKTRSVEASQRFLISSASLSSPYRFKPQTATHCSGAQPFGASHCWPLSTSVVRRPPSRKNSRSNFSATCLACFLVAIPL